MKKAIELLNRTFLIYGVIVFFLAIESLVVGESAKAVTTIFATEGTGLPTLILMQFLGLAFVISLINQVLTIDTIIMKVSSIKLLVLRLGLCFIATFGFIVIFNWFKLESLISWLYFILCFALSFGLSILLSATIEKKENKKLEDALKEYKSKIENEITL